jgi:hypothetical protein
VHMQSPFRVVGVGKFFSCGIAAIARVLWFIGLAYSYLVIFHR